MATFDVSFLNPKLRKSGSDYGFLVDQLAIKENQLSSDGKLSPGDYDYLLGEAQKLYSHPGFTKEQRSNIQVKISGWEREKKVTNLKDSQDISRLNNEIKDDALKSSMLLAGKPTVFMDANIASTRAKLNSLTDSINQLQQSGDDYSSHMLEYEATINTYNDLLQAKDDMVNYQNSPGKPNSTFAAYVNTNSKGEVTGITIDKSGSKTGYAETNGLYGGLPIYGNAKVVNGKQTFKIGDQTFSATNILVPDPQNPGSFKNNKLVSENSQLDVGGGRTRATAGSYVDVSPDTIRSQSVVPAGSYAKGSKGFIYQANEDGSYKKIINSTPEQLGVDINDIMSIPKDYENNLIIPRVTETIDSSMPPVIPQPPIYGPSQDTGANLASTQQPNPQSTPSVGRPNTAAPVERAPKESKGIAGRAVDSAKGFLASLFGK